jgi:hypothetical protein
MTKPARVLALVALGLGVVLSAALLVSLDPLAPIGVIFVMLYAGVALALIFFFDLIARTARDVFRRPEDDQSQDEP